MFPVIRDSLQRQREQLLIWLDQVLVTAFGHCAGVLDLHRTPAHDLTGRFQVDGHAGLHRDVGCVRQERIVDFFSRTKNKWKLPRFKPDRVSQEKI